MVSVGMLVLLSLPYWLPAAVLALRVRIFTRINGEEGIPIPGKLVDASRFRQVYSNPAASGRSRGAALSNLFWYWLAPGPEMHQEHLENGPKYEAVARTTRRILGMQRKTAEDLATACTLRVVERQNIRDVAVVRLRDLMMPIWAEFYYEVVFGALCPLRARQLIVDNANDVVTALKCCSLRHMEKRERLTQFLIGKLQRREVPHELPERLSTEEKAFYLQGTYFNTAVVQMSEAMVHLMMVIAQHPEIQARLASDSQDDSYLDRVITETFRMYPLFGISHRITSAEIAVDEHGSIPAGSVLCFNHPEYHRTGFADPDRFDPDRWLKLAPLDEHYIPFGVAANRPCPAMGLAPVTMRTAARALLDHYAFYSSASHSRSIPNRGPCLAVSRATGCEPRMRTMVLLFVKLRDRWEDVGRSLVQLVLGTYMVWDARRLRLCDTYFDGQELVAETAKEVSSARACPYSAPAEDRSPVHK